MEDREAATAKERYVEALFRLSETKSINKITVTDILRETHTARQTFYNNFRDINDLIAYVFVYHFERNYDIFNTREGSLESLRFVREHRAFFRQIPHHTGQNNFHETHDRMLKQGYYKLVFQTEHPPADDPRKALIDAYVYGCTNLFLDWCASDMTEPPDDVLVDVYWSTKPDFIPMIVPPCAMTNEV